MGKTFVTSEGSAYHKKPKEGLPKWEGDLKDTSFSLRPTEITGKTNEPAGRVQRSWRQTLNKYVTSEEKQQTS